MLDIGCILKLILIVVLSKKKKKKKDPKARFFHDDRISFTCHLFRGKIREFGKKKTKSF